MLKLKNYQIKFKKIIQKTCLLISIGILSTAIKPKQVNSAEKIVTFVGPLEISVSVDSLEKFAEEGKINQDLALITNRLDEETLTQFREILRKPVNIDPILISRYGDISIVEGALSKIGEIVKIDSDINGLKGIRSAAILAGLDENEGLTVINFLRHFPTEEVYLDFDYLVELGKQLQLLFNYRQLAVGEIIKQSEAEAEEFPVNLSLLAADISQPGSNTFSLEKMTLVVEDETASQVGLPSQQVVEFNLYLPNQQSQPAPLIIIVQGYGAAPTTYGYIAEQLASHGYAVASIDHIGRNLAQRQASIARGELGDLATPIEFIIRPSDVTNLLNKLEELAANQPEWSNKLNLEQVGIFGYSFGGYTALAVAGAEVNQSRLNQACAESSLSIDLSLILQCRAQYLPLDDLSFKDSRIKAVFALYPTTNPIFGPEGISKIDIPTLIWTSSDDNIVEPLQNQIHSFLWLENPDKYLVMHHLGTHFSTVSEEVINQMNHNHEEARRDSSETARKYLKALTLAFFNKHLRELEEFAPYLTAAYTQDISTAEFSLYLTKDLQIEQLETAYGGKPSLAILQDHTPSFNSTPISSIETEIRETGVLKVAVRSEAPPYGYLERSGNWSGYCANLVKSLEEHLELKFNRSGGIQVVVLPSTLENRRQLIEENRVYLECGPNLFREDYSYFDFSPSVSTLKSDNLVAGVIIPKDSNLLTTDIVDIFTQANRVEEEAVVTTLFNPEFNLYIDNQRQLSTKFSTLDNRVTLLTSNEGEWQEIIKNFLSEWQAEEFTMKNLE